LEEVTENFRRVSLWSEQVRLVKGRFKDTAPAAPVGKIAVLRLDGDLYESTIRFCRRICGRVFVNSRAELRR
jgi:O-methyltransferase